EFRPHAAGAGEVVGPGSRVDGHRLDLETGGDRLRFAEAGSGDLELADLGDGSTDHAGEGRVPSADVDADDAALLVGVGAEGDGGEGSHVRVECAHGLGGLLDEGHVEAVADEGLGHLQADVAANYDDGPGGAAVFDAPAEGDAVVEDLNAVDAAGIGAGQLGT